MPSIFLSPSTQEYNPYVGGGSEEYYMNLLADALTDYLEANFISYTRNDPNENAASAIRKSNSGNYDLHLALHSNASPAANSGKNRGIDIYHYPGSQNGLKGAEIFKENLRNIYPLKDKVRVLSTTRLGEVRQTKAPAVYLEIGYHDNPEDAEFIKSNIPDIAREIARSLTDYFSLDFKEPDLMKNAVVRLSSGNLNLRSEPSVSAPIIGKIPNGARIVAENRYNGWYYTEYDGKRGFVSASYIEII